VLSGLAFAAFDLLGATMHTMGAIDHFGAGPAGHTWADVGVGALESLAALLVYALAVWLGFWFTSPRIHEHRMIARVAMIVFALPGALGGLLGALFVSSVMRGPA
jgi:hypothetical protein